ncbi:uncharacterized protein [Argopecten irradians]|uniref:uncharacterized protein n=1 Tax=Argopecten irradians TaxID=31199 RepID=UPI00372046E3
MRTLIDSLERCDQGNLSSIEGSDVEEEQMNYEDLDPTLIYSQQGNEVVTSQQPPETNTKTGVPDLELENGVIETEDEGKSKEVNTFFASVFTKEDLNIIPTPTAVNLQSELLHIQVTTEQVFKKLSKLDASKSPGPDGDNMMGHLDRNNTIMDEQFGFIKGKSTTLQLLKVHDEITEKLDEGENFGYDIFGLKKAFDTVPQERLIKMLINVGVRGKIVTWISKFLEGSRQRVVVNGIHSDWIEVYSGVPQDSVLGPILFMVYINDLPKHILGKSKLFADDTKIYGSCNQLEDSEKIKVIWTSQVNGQHYGN